MLDGFQFEGGSIGNRERLLEWPTPAAPVGPERGYYLFHYTYGVEYSAEGLPMELQVTQFCAILRDSAQFCHRMIPFVVLQVGEWSLDKRHYMGGPPPRALAPPPACAHDRAWVLRALYAPHFGAIPRKSAPFCAIL